MLGTKLSDKPLDLTASSIAFNGGRNAASTSHLGMKLSGIGEASLAGSGSGSEVSCLEWRSKRNSASERRTESLANFPMTFSKIDQTEDIHSSRSMSQHLKYPRQNAADSAKSGEPTILDESSSIGVSDEIITELNGDRHTRSKTETKSVAQPSTTRTKPSRRKGGGNAARSNKTDHSHDFQQRDRASASHKTDHSHDYQQIQHQKDNHPSRTRAMKRSRRDELKEQTTDAPTVSTTKAVQRHCCQGDVVVKKSRRQEEVNGNCQGAQPGFYWPGNFKFVTKGNCSYFVLPTRPPAQEEYGDSEFEEEVDEDDKDDDEDDDDEDDDDDDDEEMRRNWAPEMKPRTPFENESNRFVGDHAETRPKATLAEEWNWNFKMPKALKKLKAELIGAKRAAEYRVFDRL